MDVGLIALAVVGAALLLNGLALLRASKCDTGLVIMISVGAVAVAFAFFFDLICALVPLWLISAFVQIIAFGAAFALALGASLFAFGRRNTVRFDEDAVIVLGATVRAGRLSATLRRRLNTAIEYARRNPRALVVLAGGVGPGETIAEADAMAKYVRARGVHSSRIAVENRSQNTRENFVLSKAILDERIGGNYAVAFVTSRYHVRRAARHARQAGLEARSMGAPTPPHAILPSYLRETLAVCRLWILGY